MAWLSRAISFRTLGLANESAVRLDRVVSVTLCSALLFSVTNTRAQGRTWGARNEFPFGLQLVLRGEMLRLQYDSNARSREVGGKVTDVDVTAVSAGANYWATKHIRVTGQYTLFTFPGLDPLHEIAFRLGLAL